MLMRISFEKSKNCHIKLVAEAEKKLREQFHYRQSRNDKSHDFATRKLLATLSPIRQQSFRNDSNFHRRVLRGNVGVKKTELPPGNPV